jgi:hypothetical protein
LTISPLAVRSDAKPRVSSYPPYGTSAGQEAIDLAASAGLILDPWQQDILRHALGERPDGTWSAFEVAVIVSRQNGKGAILEARELAGILLFGERLILHSAHEMKTASEAFRRVRDLFTNYDDLRRRVDRVTLQRGDEGIELRNGARLRFVARSTGSGRGFSGDCIILDEAYAVTDAHMEAMMPTMSARPNPQLWYTSSPPLDAVNGEQLFRVRRRGLAGSARLAYFDFGADGCLDNLAGIDLDDRNLWAATNPALGYRVTEESIESERGAMSDAGFARERLGIWPPDLSQGFQVIPADDWTQAQDLASKVDGPVVFSAAVALDRSNAAIAAAGARPDGLRHIEVVETGKGAGWVVPSLVRLAGAHKPAAVVIDEFGPTGSLIPELEQAGVKVERIGTSDAARAFGMFYDGICGQPYLDKDTQETVNPRNLRHLGQAELSAAVAGAVKRSLGDGSAWDRKNAAVDITPLVAVTNANWGFAHFGQKKPATPWVVYA